MTMQMHAAFDAQMLAQMTLYRNGKGGYDSDNEWVDGVETPHTIYGVIKAGNKFSQFDEGIALQAMDGGARLSDFRTLYITDRYPITEMEDHVVFKGTNYNVLQRSDETIFGFNSYLLEKSKKWRPKS